MFRKLYEWVMRLAASRHAPASLAVISFAESSFFPIPPDVMLAPMVLAKPQRAFLYAAICTVASVLGGLFGYAIGVFLEPIGHQLLSLFGHPQGQEEFHQWFSQWGVWIILVKGLTPIPYKLVTITSGFAGYNIWLFVVCSIIARGGRFFVVAILLNRYGEWIRAQIEKRLGLWVAIGAAVLVLGFIVAFKLI